MEIKVSKDVQKGIVTVNDDKILDFDFLIDIAEKVLENDEEIILYFEGFDENPDIKKFYEDIFDNIKKLKQDSQIIELLGKIRDLEENDVDDERV
ncbi:MAG: hypothetical protein ACOX40_00805 [Bacilli bacterium]